MKAPLGWTLVGAAAAGALAGTAAQLADPSLRVDGLTPREAVAALGALAWLGMPIGIGGVALAWLGLRLRGRTPPVETASRWLLATFVGTFALILASGYAWMAGAVASLDSLPGVTRVALVAVPLAAILASAATALGVPVRWLGGATPARLAGLLAAGTLVLIAAGFALVAGSGGTNLRALLGCVIALGVASSAVWLLPRRPGLLVTGGLLGLVLATFWAWPHRTVTPPSESPVRAPGSVVVIVLDTLRADAIGAYGGPPGATPTLDALAARGTLFEQVISPSPWTVPSHASIFTGLFPRSHRCWFGDRRWLDDDFVTLADRFQSAGYETAAFVSNGYLFITNLLQGFDVTRAIFRKYDDLVLAKLMRYTGIGWQRWIDKGADEAVTSIDSWLARRDPKRPFFLFLNLFEVHEPYHPPLRDRALPPGTTNLDAIRATRHFESTRWLSLRKREGETQDVLRALYAAEVRYQDRRLGEILALLDAHVDARDVTVVVTSDHGENLGDGGRWGHVFEINDALIHVPLVIRAPGRMPAGERDPRPFQTLDIGPTVLSLAGLDPTLGEGRSLLPGARTPRDATFAEVYPDYFRLARMRVGIRPGLGDFRWPIRTVREGDRKLVEWGSGPDGRSALFDPGRDRDEERDLKAAEPERFDALAERLRTWAAERPRGTSERDPHAPLDDDTRERLKALGYL